MMTGKQTIRESNACDQEYKEQWAHHMRPYPIPVNYTKQHLALEREGQKNVGTLFKEGWAIPCFTEPTEQSAGEHLSPEQDKKMKAALKADWVRQYHHHKKFS